MTFKRANTTWKILDYIAAEQSAPLLAIYMRNFRAANCISRLRYLPRPQISNKPHVHTKRSRSLCRSVLEGFSPFKLSEIWADFKTKKCWGYKTPTFISDIEKAQEEYGFGRESCSAKNDARTDAEKDPRYSFAMAAMICKHLSLAIHWDVYRIDRKSVV